jgi:hypothetical protein
MSNYIFKAISQSPRAGIFGKMKINEKTDYRYSWRRNL